ncbi:MAG: AlbA family DNA-binding domain-containing protein [Actinomycetota bacterium]
MNEEFQIKEYKGLSPRAVQLLNTQENTLVDFKRNIEGLKSRDLVAFANSKNGGAILIGVDEVDNENGLQRGKVVGCVVNDEEKMKIVSKAQSCIPEIELKIFIENIESGPFFRIEIPSGNYKPYCTAKGIYMIRGDGRNNPLTPNNLLNIFLEEQGKEFIERFSYATKKLDQKLSNTKSQVDGLNHNVNQIKEKINEGMGSLVGDLGRLSAEIERKLELINDSDYSEVCSRINMLQEKVEYLLAKIDSSMKTSF